MSGINSAEIRSATRANPAGICIYCGRTDSLREEHVVPFALGGNLILPDASCPDCCDITSAFETKVLRGFMHDARIVGRFPTRHRKKRPSTVPIKVKRENAFEPVDLRADDAVGILQLPKLERAAFLAGKPPVKGTTVCGTQTIGFGKPLEEVGEALGVKTLQFTSNVDAYSFVRMLAKIGYSYAAASVGPYPLNEVPVLPLIRGKADDGSTWVGSADYQLDIEAQKPRHALQLMSLSGTCGGAAEEVLVARVKLFADSGATGYEVVVRRKPLGSG